MNEWIRLLFSLTLSGSVMFAAAVVVRFAFARWVPKWFLCCLWLPVLFSFLFPLGSPYSVFSNREVKTEIVVPASPHFLQTEVETVHAIGQHVPEFVPQAPPKASPPYSFLLSLWACGAVTVLSWNLIGYQRFRRRMLSAVQLPEEWEESMLRCLAGNKKVPKLLHSSEAKGPVLTGVWKSTLFLPDTAYPPEILEDILAHELCHRKRHDLALKWFAALVRCIHWFNPVSWWLAGQIDRDCELACDEQVLRDQNPERCRRYGRTLVLIAAGQGSAQSLTAPMYSQKQRLKERLEIIMNQKKFGRHITVLLCIAALLMGLSTMFLGVYAGNMETGELSDNPASVEADSSEPSAPQGAEKEPAVEESAAEKEPAIEESAAEKEPAVEESAAEEQPFAEELPAPSAEQNGFLFPLEAESVAISAHFASRANLGIGETINHKGVDFAADSGTNILAAGDGVVVTSDYVGSYGVYVIIDHGDGRSTLYAHMLWDSCTVSQGDTVTAGQVIGQVGSTGVSTGPHLHFELWQDGVAVDPLDSLPVDLSGTLP